MINDEMNMTKDEMKMLHSYIDLSTHYLEFGSGESTIYASNVPTIKTIDSVESSDKFINEILMSNAVIANAILITKRN